MADELNTDAGEGQEQHQEPSPAEIEAREQGWVPKEDFQGEEHKWVDAAEFLRRGELFGKIESQSRELKEMRAVLSQFKGHHEKVQEAAYQRALKELREKKKEALVEGDADELLRVEDQIDAIKGDQAQMRAAAQTQAPQQAHPVFVNWVNRNSWYDNNKPMRSWADVRGAELQAEGKSAEEVLRSLEREVREEFPKRFENPNRSKPGAVESPAGRGAGKNSTYNPSEIERSMAKKFVRSGLYKNEQEYYSELASMGKD